MLSILYKYLVNIRGASAVEYGLLAAGIALALVVAIFFMGDSLMTLFYEDLPDLIDGAGS